MTKKHTDPSVASARKLLSFGLLFAGCVFLCNPNINLFDIFPDFIGYGLLVLALREVSSVFPHFDDARRGFRILFWTNVAKMPAIFIMLYITGIDLEERGLITVFALGFAVVEWIFAIPAFRALFEGFIYIGEREGVMRALYGKDKGKGVEGLSVLTVSFLLVKGALSFAPELVYLSTFFHNGSLSPGAVNPVVFYPILAVLGALIGLVFGLVWLFSIRPYFRDLRLDGAMQSLLAEKGVSLLPILSAAAEKRRSLAFFSLASLGFFFAVDPLIENRDLLPNALSALAFFAAFWFAEQCRAARWGKALSSAYFATSVALTVFSSLFFSEFTYVDVAFRDAALTRYVPVLIFTVLEAIFFFLSVLCALFLFRDYTLTHTGSHLRPEDTVSYNGIHKELHKETRRLGIFVAAYALLRPISALLLIKTEKHVITPEEANEFYSAGSVVYSAQFAWLWMLILIAGILLTVLAFSHIRRLKAEGGLLEETE